MAHTNQTAHYHLPQYVGTDIINPLTDTNKAYEDIDTALYEQGQNIADVVDDIDALKIQNGDSALDTTAQTLSGAINELKSGADALGLRVTASETNISTLQTQMSTATGNITTLNTSVAGLQTEVASKASATALNDLTLKVGTGNLNTTAQNCVDAINEVLAQSGTGHTYSSTEKAIGTFGNKTVYEKTYSGTAAADQTVTVDAALTLSYVDDVLSIDGTFLANNDWYGLPIRFNTDASNVINIRPHINASGLQFANAGGAANTKYIITVKYTKA